MSQKSEEAISVLADSLLIFLGGLRAKVLSQHPVLKSSGWFNKFVEVPTLQSELVDVIDNGLKQFRASRDLRRGRVSPEILDTRPLTDASV